MNAYMRVQLDRAVEEFNRALEPVTESNSDPQNTTKADAAWSLLERNFVNVHKACDEAQVYMQTFLFNKESLKKQVTVMMEALRTSRVRAPEAVQLDLDLKLGPSDIPTPAAPSSLKSGAQPNNQ